MYHCKGTQKNTNSKREIAVHDCHIIVCYLLHILHTVYTVQYTQCSVTALYIISTEEWGEEDKVVCGGGGLLPHLHHLRHIPPTPHQRVTPTPKLTREPQDGVLLKTKPRYRQCPPLLPPTRYPLAPKCESHNPSPLNLSPVFKMHLQLQFLLQRL